LKRTAQNAVIFIKKIPAANVMLRKHFFGTDRCECCIYHIVEETFKDRMESDLGTRCFKDYDEAAAMLRAFTKAG
jgi:hypothetical protein